MDHNKEDIYEMFVGNKVYKIKILLTQTFKRNFLPVRVLQLALTTGVKYKSQNIVFETV